MKLGVLIKDEEYRDALVKKITSYDNNIFVNVIGNNVKDASDSLILTDVPPSDIDIKVLNKQIEEIVAREQVLRDEIKKIIAEIEVDNE